MEFVDSTVVPPLVMGPPPKKTKQFTLEDTSKKEGADKATKRKLDFDSSVNVPHEQPPTVASGSSLGYVSMKRRLVRMGNAKIGQAKEDAHSGDINTFDETTLHSSDSSDRDSFDELLTLSDIVRPNKPRQSTIRHALGETNSDNSDACLATGEKIEKGTPTKNRPSRRKSSTHVVLDDDSSEEDLNVCRKLARHELPTEDATEDVSKLRRSARGRVIKPKKYH